MQGLAGESSSAGVSSRVKRLEDKIPELQAKLRKHMKQGSTTADSGSADGITRRVEVLEEAVETLLDAQVCGDALLPHLFSASSKSNILGESAL